MSVPASSVDNTTSQAPLAGDAALFRQLADAMPQIVFAARPDGHVDYFNRRWYEYTGLPEGAAGIESWRHVHTEDGLRRVERAWNESLRTGQPYEIEYLLRRHDGAYRWHLGRALPVRDAAGTIVRWFGTNTDIHDQKLSEEAVRRARQQMELVVRGANVGVWYCDLPFDELVWDEKVKEHFHLPPDARVTIETFYERMHPDDRSRTRAAIEASIANRTPYDIDYRTVSADGARLKWIRAIGRTFYDDAGQPIRFDGVTVDVTERTRALIDVRESEARFRHMSDNAPVMIWVTEPDGSCIYLNKPWYDFTGQAGQDAFGLGWVDAVHPDDRSRAKQAFLDANERRARFSVDYRLRRRDGEYRWCIDSAAPRYGANGEYLGYVGSVLDITDRKLAEDAARGSEARSATVLAGALDCVIAMDHHGRVVEWNPAAERTFGHARADAIGREMAELIIPPQFRERHRAGLARYLDTREGPVLDNRLEVSAIRKDGTEFPVELAITRLPSDEAAPMFVGFLRDISARKRVEQQLRDSEEHLRLAIAIAQMGTFQIDLVTDAVAVNDPGRAIYGWAPDEPLTFAKVQTHFHPADRKMVIERVADSFRPDGQGGFEVEQRIIRTDGATRWIRVRGRTLFETVGEARRAVRCVGTYIDVTEQKAVEEEREQLLTAERISRAEAERASRMKDEFLATLSHELRTPLNAILGWATILKDGANDAEDLAQGLETIERNARAQTQIIEDLLDMSRIISGKVRLDVQRVDLAEVARSAIETVRPGAQAKGLRLQAVLDPHVGTVSGDPNRLQQVMWNLLSNAIKFTPRGGRVQVVLARVNSHVELSVSDTGEGIRPEFLVHVFDRFRQADSSTTRRYGGLGLGLAIVKQLVELHGGTVRAHSAGPGEGATFTVALPLVALQVDPEAEDPARRHPLGHASPPLMIPDQCARIAGVRVLVVDDEPDARMLVRRLLEDCEAVVSTAESAREALERLERDPPDVLVSDIGMPGEDGYSLIRRVRALGPDRGGNTPAVALTAYARAEDRVRSVLAGFQMHVSKPVEPAELITMVASLAGRTGASSAS